MLCGHAGTGHLHVLCTMTCFPFGFSPVQAFLYGLLLVEMKELWRDLCVAVYYIKQQKAQNDSKQLFHGRKIKWSSGECAAGSTETFDIVESCLSLVINKWPDFRTPEHITPSAVFSQRPCPCSSSVGGYFSFRPCSNQITLLLSNLNASSINQTRPGLIHPAKSSPG